MPTTANPLIRNWTPDETPDLMGKTFLVTTDDESIRRRVHTRGEYYDFTPYEPNRSIPLRTPCSTLTIQNK